MGSLVAAWRPRPGRRRPRAGGAPPPSTGPAQASDAAGWGRRPPAPAAPRRTSAAPARRRAAGARRRLPRHVERGPGLAGLDLLVVVEVVADEQRGGTRLVSDPAEVSLPVHDRERQPVGVRALRPPAHAGEVHRPVVRVAHRHRQPQLRPPSAVRGPSASSRRPGPGRRQVTVVGAAGSSASRVAVLVQVGVDRDAVLPLSRRRRSTSPASPLSGVRHAHSSGCAPSTRQRSSRCASARRSHRGWRPRRPDRARPRPGRARDRQAAGPSTCRRSPAARRGRPWPWSCRRPRGPPAALAVHRQARRRRRRRCQRGRGGPARAPVEHPQTRRPHRRARPRLGPGAQHRAGAEDRERGMARDADPGAVLELDPQRVHAVGARGERRATLSSHAAAVECVVVGEAEPPPPESRRTSPEQSGGSRTATATTRGPRAARRTRGPRRSSLAGAEEARGRALEHQV